MMVSERGKGKETITYGEVSAIESLGKHPGVSEVLERDLLVPVKAQIDEVEHLSDDWSSRFRKVPLNN